VKPRAPGALPDPDLRGKARAGERLDAHSLARASGRIDAGGEPRAERVHLELEVMPRRILHRQEDFDDVFRPEGAVFLGQRGRHTPVPGVESDEEVASPRRESNGGRQTRGLPGRGIDESARGKSDEAIGRRETGHDDFGRHAGDCFTTETVIRRRDRTPAGSRRPRAKPVGCSSYGLKSRTRLNPICQSLFRKPLSKFRCWRLNATETSPDTIWSTVVAVEFEMTSEKRCR